MKIKKQNVIMPFMLLVVKKMSKISDFIYLILGINLR